MKNRFVAFCAATTATLMMATATRADYMTGNGSSGNRTGNYSYEVWSNDNNTQYVLKIWKRDAYPNGSPFVMYAFSSMGEALNYFDCYYGDRPDKCRR